MAVLDPSEARNENEKNAIAVKLLQQRIRRFDTLAKKTPQHGSRHSRARTHSWLGVAINLPVSRIEEACERQWSYFGEEPEPYEIENLIDSAKEKQTDIAMADELYVAKRTPDWKLDEDLREDVIAEMLKHYPDTLNDLRQISPIGIPLNQLTPSDCINGLFTDTEHIIAGAFNYPNFFSGADKDINEQYEYLLANPVKDAFGVKSGAMHKEIKKRKVLNDLGRRTNENVAYRKYLVIESDIDKDLPLDENLNRQAAIIIHLSAFAPLVCATYSGNKSIHALYETQGDSEEHRKKFFQYAVMLGADHHMWTPCQMTRTPMAINKSTRKQQTVHYFNPPKFGQRPYLEPLPNI